MSEITLTQADGCEWNPDTDAPAVEGDHHNATVPAVYSVGVRDNLHLCESCAALPRFRRRSVQRLVRFTMGHHRCEQVQGRSTR
ncbi:MAG: hypothetical protein AB7P99_13965 [Vicinamibacterales bacterium]